MSEVVVVLRKEGRGRKFREKTPSLSEQHRECPASARDSGPIPGKEVPSMTLVVMTGKELEASIF
jgi:hypothetical protein